MDIRGVCLGIRGRRRVCPKSQEPNDVGMALPQWTQPYFLPEEILVKFLPCVESPETFHQSKLARSRDPKPRS